MKIADKNYSKVLKKIKASNQKAGSILEDWIAIGELFLSIKESVDDFKEFLEQKKEINYKQATKYIRIAIHQGQARLETPGSIDEYQKSLPKASDPPRITTARPENLGYVGKQPGLSVNTKDSWFTPAIYVEAARNTMGSIDFDPFSSEVANKNIKAETYYTASDDAFQLPWCSEKGTVNNVWMNPPYSRGVLPLAVERFISEHKKCNFDQAIVLLNSATDTQWYHDMMAAADAFCITKGRISFDNVDGKSKSGNTKGQVFFYFGKAVQQFADNFRAFGIVMTTEVL